jgi:hypothetical protein
MDERGGPTSLPLSFFNSAAIRGALLARITHGITIILLFVNYYFDTNIDFQIKIYYNIS